MPDIICGSNPTYHRNNLFSIVRSVTYPDDNLNVTLLRIHVRIDNKYCNVDPEP